MVVLLMIVYVIIFLIGSVGNLIICLIFWKWVYLYIVINIYLLNLVIVDFFMIVLGKNFVEDFFCFEFLGIEDIIEKVVN